LITSRDIPYYLSKNNWCPCLEIYKQILALAAHLKYGLRVALSRETRRSWDSWLETWTDTSSSRDSSHSPQGTGWKPAQQTEV